MQVGILRYQCVWFFLHQNHTNLRNTPYVIVKIVNYEVYENRTKKLLSR